MSYECTVRLARQGRQPAGEVRITVIKEGINLMIWDGTYITGILLPPEEAEKVQEALDTALCYYGDQLKSKSKA